MTTIPAGPKGPVAMVKGAPEAVLPLCSRQHGAEAPAAFDRKAAAATTAAEQGFRVLALGVEPALLAWPYLFHRRSSINRLVLGRLEGC